MRSKPMIGCVVWHDLLTNDVERAKHFYAELLGWEYQTEHATDFAWRSGEADYPLIMARGEAHGGFVDPGQEISSHWLAYITVADVDAAVAEARRLGATIDREPFDVPGVGRSAVIRDPQGGIVSPHRPGHDFPPPSGAFLGHELVTADIESAQAFYGALFGWTADDVDVGETNPYVAWQRMDGADAGCVMKRPTDASGPAAWITYLATDDVDATVAKAKTLGASVRADGTRAPNARRSAVLTDPTGAVFGLRAGDEAHEP